MPTKEHPMTPFTKHPEALELIATINAKNKALATIKADIDVLATQISDGAPDDDGATRVAAALEYARTGVAVQPQGAIAALHEKHVLLRQQLEALSGSVKADHRELSTLQSTLSGEASAAVATEHKAVVAEALAALQAFDAACEKEQALAARLGAAGYDFRAGTWAAWPLIGRLHERSQSTLWNHVRELSSYAK